jgi:hypothetical protein
VNRLLQTFTAKCLNQPRATEIPESGPVWVPEKDAKGVRTGSMRETSAREDIQTNYPRVYGVHCILNLSQ